MHSICQSRNYDIFSSGRGFCLRFSNDSPSRNYDTLLVDAGFAPKFRNENGLPPPVPLFVILIVPRSGSAAPLILIALPAEVTLLNAAAPEPGG
jgi:hypothetical protein